MGVRAAIQKLLPPRHPLRAAYHRARGLVAATRAGFPQKSLRIIGVTGTDGKTTTVGMTAHILRSQGRKVGACSTTFFRINDEIRWNETHMTSVEHSVFQRSLQEFVDHGCEYAVIEASSHGLVQGRLGPIHPEVAAITNTSLEHLDYHGTMKRYRRDKSILFRCLRRGGTKVINAEDGSCEILSRISRGGTIFYSTEEMPPAASKNDGLLWISGLKVNESGSSAKVHWKKDGRETCDDLHLSIPGSYNMENALASVACTLAVGIDIHAACLSLKSFQGIPGRLERIDEGQKFSVFVDFTVTPLAYERALTTIREMHPGGRLLVLTGACGDRMREKRPQIGSICSRIADVVVVTTDETRQEDPLTVIDEVWEGVNQTQTEAKKIIDRREAISWLMEQAKPHDAVVLCGMGACQSMQTRDGLVPWDEREVARECLRALRA